MPKTQRFELQLRADHLSAARKVAHDRGLDSFCAYFRALLEHDTRQNQQHDKLETAVASSIDRVAKEMRRLHNANQALFALTDSLVRLFLTCTPEPPADVLDATKRRAKLRYERFMLSVAQNMTGDARAALLDVLKGDPDA